MRQIIRSELRGVVVGFMLAAAVVALLGCWPSAQAASGGAPGALPAAAPQAQVPVPGGPGFVMIPGVSFVPMNSATQPSYDEYGSVYNNGGGNTFTAPVFLPNNAKITKMTIFYYDNNSDGYVRVRLMGNVQNTASSP